MKKALLVLLALALTGAFLFAEEAAPTAKFGAWMEGDAYLYDSTGNTSWGPNWAGAGVYNTLTFSYADKSFGWNGTVEYPMADFYAEGGFRDFAAWYKITDFAKVSVGLLRIGDYRLTDFIHGNGYTRIASAEYGVLAQIFPVEGASVGVFYNVPETATAVDIATQFNFAASYAIPDLAKVILQYRTSDKLIDVGVEINAIKGLPIAIGFEGGLATGAVAQGFLTASYGMDALSFVFSGAVSTSPNLVYYAELQAEYKLVDAFSAGARLGYDNGVGWFVGAKTGVEVYPYVVARFGGSELNLGFQFVSDGSYWAIPLRYVIAF